MAPKFSQYYGGSKTLNRGRKVIENPIKSRQIIFKYLVVVMFKPVVNIFFLLSVVDKTFIDGYY